jgi:hypothetical protein
LGKERFLLFLLSCCALVFVFATSPEVNGTFPFVDGLRFMPSFFLPVFFISGAGALFLLERAFRWARAAGKRLKLDELDTAVSFTLAVLLPLSALFASSAMASMDQYSAQASSLEAAAEYSSLQAAYSLTGSECVVFAGRNGVSFYPIYEDALDRTRMTGESGPDGIALQMKAEGCRYLLFGSTSIIINSSEATRFQKYSALSQSPMFEEIEYGGTVRLFRMREID